MAPKLESREEGKRATRSRKRRYRSTNPLGHVPSCNNTNERVEMSSPSESESSSSVSSSSTNSSESDSSESENSMVKPTDQEQATKPSSKKRKTDATTNGNHPDSESISPALNRAKSPTTTHPKPPEDEASAPEGPSLAPRDPPRNPITKDPFEAWYMRAITREFGEDLDKVRSAPDFKETSVPILVNALKQGVACFSAGERSVILGESEQ